MEEFQERIDDAVARVLRAKFELGLFENPYVSK
jgi:beta-glucosidase